MGNSLPSPIELKRKIDEDYEIAQKRKIDNILTECEKFVVYNQLKNGLFDHLKNGLNWERGNYYYKTTFDVNNYAYLTKEKMAECLRHELYKRNYPIVNVSKENPNADSQGNVYYKLTISIPNK